MINSSLDRIIDVIKDSDIYIKYTNILNQVKNNSDINITVNEIKSIQKRIVNDNHRGIDTTIIEKELDVKNKFLNDIPLYQDYLASSLELNELIKNVIDRLQAYIDSLNN